MTDAQRARFDATIGMVMDLVRHKFESDGHNAARKSLIEARRDCQNKEAAKAAAVLLNDYRHLVDGGCHPRVAMMITLTHPKDLA